MEQTEKRFSFLVEQAFGLQDGGCVVAGRVHGPVKNHEAVYLIQPDGTSRKSTIEGIETYHLDADKKVSYTMVEQVENNPASLRIDAIDKENLPRFTVITNIAPQKEPDVTTALENPYLAGLIQEYERFYTDHEYTRFLTQAVLRAYYLIPVYLDKKPEDNREGISTLAENTHMSFVTVAPKDHPDEPVFPVFTDWDALSRWQEVFKDHPRRSMIIRFNEAVEIAKKYTGLVINPYGPMPVFYTIPQIRRMMESEEYKRLFTEQTKDNQTAENFVIGVPKDSPEVRHIRRVLRDYGRTHTDVKAIYVLLKADTTGKTEYLIIVDTKQETEKAIFDEIAHIIRKQEPELNGLEFLPLRQAEPIQKEISQSRAVYVKQ